MCHIKKGGILVQVQGTDFRTKFVLPARLWAKGIQELGAPPGFAILQILHSRLLSLSPLLCSSAPTL
jgi:hypothetical protein